jgi:hypothetical protein
MQSLLTENGNLAPESLWHGVPKQESPFEVRFHAESLRCLTKHCWQKSHIAQTIAIWPLVRRAKSHSSTNRYSAFWHRKLHLVRHATQAIHGSAYQQFLQSLIKLHNYAMHIHYQGLPEF